MTPFCWPLLGVTALAIVMQTIILLAVFVAVRKAARAVKEEAEDLRSAMMPSSTTRAICTPALPPG